MAIFKNKMDLTEGSVLKKLLLFAIPIILTNILQQLYHAADMVVVGNFAKDSTTALAAVGSTASITSLCLNLFIGLAVGANVVCARLFGAKKEEELRRAMHTSVLLAALCGVGIGILGVIFSRPLLVMTGSPADVIDHATLYMQIIFMGQPGSLVYNFGAGILRSHGDTKRPMYILMSSGLVNVILNLVLVIGFHLDSAGVAIATVVSYYLSAAAVLWILFSPHGEFRLSFSELRLSKELRDVTGVGIPSGLNSMVFSLSNVIIISALNSLGGVVLAGNSAAHNVDATLYQVLVAFYTACISFTGQNCGASGNRIFCGNGRLFDDFCGRRYENVFSGSGGYSTGGSACAYSLRNLCDLRVPRDQHRLSARYGKSRFNVGFERSLYLRTPNPVGYVCFFRFEKRRSVS